MRGRRSLNNAILNMELEAPFEEACKGLGFILEDLYDEEKDAALGNGGNRFFPFLMSG